MPLTADGDVPQYVRGLALGIAALSLGFQLSGWLFFAPVIFDGHCDFRQLYTAGYMVRSGRSHLLYDYPSQLQFQNALVSHADVALPFIRPAYEALLFVPLSWLSFRAAYFSWLAFNLAVLLASLRLLRPRMDALAAVHPWLPAAMFFGFLPIGAALMQGQDSILLLALFALALLALNRGRDISAGVLVGAGLFKFQITLPVLLVFSAWRKWRFSLGFLSTAAALLVGSVWLVGVNSSEVYARSLIHVVFPRSGNTAFKYPLPVLMMPNLHGLIVGLFNVYLPSGYIQGLVLFTSGLVLALVAILSSNIRDSSNALLVAITASSVVSYYLLIHDMTLLLIPILLILARFLEAENSGNKGGRALFRAAAFVFMTPGLISVAPHQFYLAAVPVCLFLYVLVRHEWHHKTPNVEPSSNNESGIQQPTLFNRARRRVLWIKRCDLGET